MYGSHKKNNNIFLKTVEQLRYFCHGIGLGTYDPIHKIGYTVFSEYVQNILWDPCLVTRIVPETGGPIPCRTDHSHYVDDWSIRSGDVVGWWNADPLPGKARPEDKLKLTCFHTARIVQPLFISAKTKDDRIVWYLSERTQITSKNGPQALKPNATLGEISNDYKQHYFRGIYRLKEKGDPTERPSDAQVTAVQKATQRNELEILEAIKNHEDRLCRAFDERGHELEEARERYERQLAEQSERQEQERLNAIIELEVGPVALFSQLHR